MGVCPCYLLAIHSALSTAATCLLLSHSSICLSYVLFASFAVPERISLPGVSKSRKVSKAEGRGSPSDTMTVTLDEDAGVWHEMDTVYINLTKREDRRKLIQGEMKAQGLKGRRFPAKTGDEVKDSDVARKWHSKLNCLFDKKTVAAGTRRCPSHCPGLDAPRPSR